HELVDFAQLDAGFAAQQAQTVQHAPGRVVRSGRDLLDDHPTGSVVREVQVGEGAAYIDSDAFHLHRLLMLGERHMTGRSPGRNDAQQIANAVGQWSTAKWASGGDMRWIF